MASGGLDRDGLLDGSDVGPAFRLLRLSRSAGRLRLRFDRRLPGQPRLLQRQPVATADEYAQQAAAIADQGQQAQPTEKDEWVALGVFGMVRGEETEANQIFQLAINKDGVLRGNYYDALSDSTLPVYGAVDKKTQRAAWTVGDRTETVYETGVGNLTEDETTMLVHFGKDRTQQWTLIRLEQPDEEK